jgi:hypothetical protein
MARKDAKGRVIYKSTSGEDKVRAKSASTGKLTWHTVTKIDKPIKGGFNHLFLRKQPIKPEPNMQNVRCGSINETFVIQTSDQVALQIFKGLYQLSADKLCVHNGVKLFEMEMQNLFLYPPPRYPSRIIYYRKQCTGDKEVLVSFCVCKTTTLMTLDGVSLVEIYQEYFLIEHLCSHIDHKGTGGELLKFVLAENADTLVGLLPVDHVLWTYYLKFNPSFPRSMDDAPKAPLGIFFFGKGYENTLLRNFTQLLSYLNLLPVPANLRRMFLYYPLNAIQEYLRLIDVKKRYTVSIDNLFFVPSNIHAPTQQQSRLSKTFNSDWTMHLGGSTRGGIGRKVTKR